jgi:hypothetical protein
MRSACARLRRERAAWALLCALATPMAARVHAQRAPIPEWVQSAEVLRAELTVFSAPDDAAPRRGALMRGARLPVLSRVEGNGCGDRHFVQLAPLAFVCERDLRLTAEPPFPIAPLPGAASNESDLPYEYLQAVHDGTRAYASLSDYATDEYAAAFGKGFAIAVAERVRDRGVAFVRTRAGYYVRQADLRPVRPSRFRGVELGELALDQVGWVIEDGAVIAADPAHGGAPSRAARLQAIRVAAERDGRLQLEGGGSIDARAVVRPELREPPAGVAPGERWIDVDLTRQVLVAYAGDKPVFATVISSGRDQPKTRTPLGEFRIWVKLRSSDMRESDVPAFEQSYAVEQVPWVQYFKDGYGLHAAFWHDRFGEKRSRGCINLSPHDARWLFEFTGPELPAGWLAARAVDGVPGTRIVVRKSPRAAAGGAYAARP